MFNKGIIFHEKLCFVEMKAFTDLFQYDITSPGSKPSLHLPSLSKLLFRPGLEVVHNATKELVRILKAEYVVS